MFINTNPDRELVGYLVRHGTTDLNVNNNWRGWDNPILNPEGIQMAEAAANYLSFEKIGRIISSDFTRAMQTAEIIMANCNVLNPYVGADPNLRSWNIGGFSGQEKTPERVAIFQRYVDNPDLVIPGGESLNQLRERNEIILQYLTVPYEGAPTVVVCHTSNIIAFYHTIQEEFDKYEEVDDVIEPGGIVAVFYDSNGVFSVIPVLGAKPEKAEPGITS